MISPDEQREALEPWARVFHDHQIAEGRSTIVHPYDAQPPDPTCPECDSDNLDDFDMAEDEDGRQYGTFHCLDCGFRS